MMTTPKKQFVLSYVAKGVSSLTDVFRSSAVENHFDIPWRIGYRRDKGHFRMLLSCDKPRVDGQPWSVATKFTFKVSSLNGKRITKTCDYVFKNDDQFNGYGEKLGQAYTIFKNYAADDTLILEVLVTIETMDGIERPAKIRNFDVAAKEFSDVVLKVEGEKFYVSRLTLATQSAYFNSLLMGKFKEGQMSEVILKGIDPKDFQNFLELCYMDKTLTDSNIENVLKLADMYDAKNGQRVCEEFLINDSKHSSRNKLRIALRFKLEKLKKHCLDSLKCRSDIRAVMGPDLAQLDASITDELLEKSVGLACRCTTKPLMLNSLY